MVELGRLKYTLGFIYCEESQQVLLLNRNKLPWMGKWNGVGGKLENDETSYDCIARETIEETGLNLPQYEPRGSLTWKVYEKGKPTDIGGLYLFTANISLRELEQYHTPKSVAEGVLEWKSLDWLTHKDNLGIVDNVKLLFRDYNLLDSKESAIFEVVYRDHIFASFEKMQS